MPKNYHDSDTSRSSNWLGPDLVTELRDILAEQFNKKHSSQELQEIGLSIARFVCAKELFEKGEK